MRRGFTLIELLVTIAIIGILTVILFANFANDQPRNAIKAATTQLVTNLQRAQTSAQSGVIPSGLTDTASGYGVAFRTGNAALASCPWKNQYVLFADLPKGSADRTFNCNPLTSDVVMQNVALPSNVEVVRLADSGGQTTSWLFVVFSYPTGTVSFAHNGGSFNDASATAEIVLKNTKINACYSAILTKAGPTPVINKRQLVNCP